MALGWTVAGMLEAERQFRQIIGYRDLATPGSGRGPSHWTRQSRTHS